MATRILTQEIIDGLRAPTSNGKQQLVWDKVTKGFGVLVSGKTTTKSYVVQGTLRRPGPDGTVSYIDRRITIARCEYVKLEPARERAKQALDQLSQNLDPKAEARKQLMQPVAAADKKDITLREALADYTASDRLAPKSIKRYRYMISHYLPSWLDRPLRSITREDVEERHKNLPAEVVAGKYDANGKNYHRSDGKRTANGALGIFKYIYSHAADDIDDMPANPCARLNRRRKGGHGWYKERRRTTFIDTADLPKFYAGVMSLENPRHRDIVRLMMFTGLRKSAACGLMHTEVDTRNRSIKIPTEKMEAKDGAADFFELPLGKFAYDMIAAQMKLRENEYVFSSIYINNAKGHLTHTDAAFDHIEKHSGVDACSNDLRRLFASTAESLDLSPYVVKALMHHALPDVTSGYMSISLERRREAMQKIEDELLKLCHARPKLVGKRKAA